MFVTFELETFYASPHDICVMIGTQIETQDSLFLIYTFNKDYLQGIFQHFHPPQPFHLLIYIVVFFDYLDLPALQ